MPSNETPWVVKGVPERIRRKVKVFAVQHDITMAQALEYIVDVAIPDQDRREPLVSREVDEIVKNALEAMVEGNRPQEEPSLEQLTELRAKVESDLTRQDLSPARQRQLEAKARLLRFKEERAKQEDTMKSSADE